MEWGYIVFGVLGIVLGRCGAVFALYIPDMYNISSGFWCFFRKCQKEWGWFSLLYFIQHRKDKPVYINLLMVEVLLPVLYVLLFYHIGWEYIVVEYSLFIFGLVVASAIDVEHLILPDSLTLSGIVLGLMGALLNPESGREFLPALFGMLIGGGFLWLVAVLYYAFRKEEGLGGGDIKLLAWIGAVLTWEAIPFVVLVSCFAGLFGALLSLVYSRKGLSNVIPFGPFLSFAALVYVFYGEVLGDYYLSLFLPVHRF